MNALVRKEFRLILPAWAVALGALVALPTGFGTGLIAAPEVCMFTFWLGMLTLGLSPFGREFSSGAFLSLLAQPFTRERLWRTKMRHLGSAALTLFCVLPFLWASRPFSYRGLEWHVFWVTACAGLAVLTGGLWTTLLLRQMTAAFWITLLVPAALALGVSLFTEWLILRLANVLQAATPSPEHIIPVVISAALVLYSIAGYWWARRLFLRAQDVGWGVVEAPVQGFAGWFKWGARPGSAPSQRPLRALAIKELQLHSLSLFFAAGVLVLHLAAIGLRKYGVESGGWHEAAKLIWALWFILPFIAGAEAVASERQLATMEGQLCLPARRRTQFAVKLFCAIAMGVILGGVMPWLLENLARLLGAGNDELTKSFTNYSVWERSNRSVLVNWAGIAAGITLISFYASALTRGTLQAMGGAVTGWILVWFLILFGARPEVLCKVQLWRGGLFYLIGAGTLVFVLIGLSYWNFKRLHHARQLWRRNLAVLGAWLVFPVVATPMVYHRAWELVLPLEPRHGPARITGSGPTRICNWPWGMFILLPDGRLWAETEGGFKRVEANMGLSFPKRGAFVGETKWQAVATAFFGPVPSVIGVQADGTLWQIARAEAGQTAPPRESSLQRIGADSDWQSVVAGYGHYLALKRDGSLWGGGLNDLGQLGDGPRLLTNGPVRIGNGSDWIAVFASQSTSAGVKRDGSLWKWGCLYHLADGKTLNKPIAQPVPVRWNLPGTDLIALESDAYSDLGVYADGSVQAVGLTRNNMLRQEAPGDTGQGHEIWLTSPLQLGRTGDWSAISRGETLAACKRDGSLWQQYDLNLMRTDGPNHLVKLSNYSDWLGVSVMGATHGSAITALAADGTLSCWLSARPSTTPQSLLRPTRGPFWSLNILDATK